MQSPTIDQKLQHIRGYAQALSQAVLLMDERRSILEPLLRDELIVEALAGTLDNTSGADAYNHFVPLLAQDLLRDLARLLLDDGPKAASLLNLYRKASVPEIRAAIRARFVSIVDNWYREPREPGADPTPTDPELTAHRACYAKDFDRTWDRLAAVTQALSSDPVAAKIRTFRNKNHAHLEMQPAGRSPEPYDVRSLGLTYDDLMTFADTYSPAVFELARLITGTVFALENFLDTHRRSAIQMWRAFAGLRGD